MEHLNALPKIAPGLEFNEDNLIFGKTLGFGRFGSVVKAEAIGSLPVNTPKTSMELKRCSKPHCSSEVKLKRRTDDMDLNKTTVAVKILKG